MRGIKFRALLRYDETGLYEVGSMSAVNPEELIQQIRDRRDKGEIEVPENSEVWVVPSGSFMERTAVPRQHVKDDDGGWTLAYAGEEDMKHGETYLSLTQETQGEYTIDGFVKAIKPETAARVAAGLKGGRMDAKKVLLVPEQTITEFTISSSG